MRKRILLSVIAFSAAFSHVVSISAAEMETCMAQEDGFVSDGITIEDMEDGTLLFSDEPGTDYTEEPQTAELTDDPEIIDAPENIDGTDIDDVSEIIDISDISLMEEQLEELETEYIDFSGTDEAEE